MAHDTSTARGFTAEELLTYEIPAREFDQEEPVMRLDDARRCVDAKLEELAQSHRDDIRSLNLTADNAIGSARLEGMVQAADLIYILVNKKIPLYLYGHVFKQYMEYCNQQIEAPQWALPETLQLFLERYYKRPVVTNGGLSIPERNYLTLPKR